MSPYYYEFFNAAIDFSIPNICEITWPIQIDATETPVATDIAFYKKNLPNIPDGAVYIIVFVYIYTSQAMVVHYHLVGL